MEHLKDMENIIGLMVVFIKVILVMELDMGMGYGKVKVRLILDLIEWIINKDLAFIHGKIRKYIKVSLEMTTNKDMDKFIV
jgi:uncharacterized protein (DUF3820 family)